MRSPPASSAFLPGERTGSGRSRRLRSGHGRNGNAGSTTTAGARPVPPEGAVYLSTHAQATHIKDRLVGSLLLVVLGGFGISQVIRLLTLLFICGLERLVSAILVVEHDTGRRREFAESIESISPVFRERVVYGFSKAFADGMGNEGVNWGLEHVDKWGRPLVKATEDALARSVRVQAAGLIRDSNEKGGDIDRPPSWSEDSGRRQCPDDANVPGGSTCIIAEGQGTFKRYCPRETREELEPGVDWNRWCAFAA